MVSCAVPATSRRSVCTLVVGPPSAQAASAASLRLPVSWSTASPASAPKPSSSSTTRVLRSVRPGVMAQMTNDVSVKR